MLNEQEDESLGVGQLSQDELEAIPGRHQEQTLDAESNASDEAVVSGENNSSTEG